MARLSRSFVAVVVAAGTLAGAGVAPARATGEADATFGTGGVTAVKFGAATTDVINATPGASFVLGSADGNMMISTVAGGNGGGDVLWNGRASVDFGVPSAGYGVASTAMGNVRVVVDAAGGDFALAAFDQSGAVVRSFGADGRVRTAWGAPATARLASYQLDGLTVFGDVGGSLGLARYDQNGALDARFGDGGRTLVDLGAGADVPLALGQGGLTIGGRTGDRAFVARFLPDGRLDPSFGDSGVSLLDLSPGEDAVNGFSGAFPGMYVTGSAGDDAFIARLTLDGRLDPAFGSGGLVRVRFGGLRATFAQVAPYDRSTKLVAVGTSTQADGRTDSLIARFTLGGAIDLVFGAGGAVVTDLGTANDGALGFFIADPPDPINGPYDTPVTVAGRSGDDWFRARYLSSGALDSQNPPEHHDFGLPSVQRAVAVAAQPDGRVVMAGTSDDQLLLMRFLSNGAVDPSFRPGHPIVSELGRQGPADVVVQPDGRLLVLAGWGGSVVVERYLPDGALDQAFADRGIARVPAPGADRLFLLAGGTMLITPSMTRLTASGDVIPRSPDASADGPPSSGGHTAIDGSGRVLSIYSQPIYEHTDVERYLADGRRDAAFNGLPLRGQAVATSGGGAGAGAGGRIFVAGYTEAAYPYPSDLVLFALGDDGTRDAHFGAAGMVRLDVGFKDVPSDILVQADGRVVVVGETIPTAGPFRLTLVRFLANGALDRSFGANGVWSTSAMSGPADAKLLPDGRLVVVGASAAGDGAAVLRFDPAAPQARTPRAAGWNGMGGLGDGTTTARVSPVAAPVAGASSVSGGAFHSLAAMANGTVAAWGSNGVGQLGDGTATDRLAPITVPGLTGVVAVGAGGYHSLALKADGTVWAWGWNGVGQLGDGTVIERHQPVRVGGLTGVTAIAAGAYHSLALKADGTVWAWGWNGVGQLGDGTTVDRHVPVQTFAELMGGIAAGAYHSIAFSTAGPVRTWGWNAYGQLGRLAPAAGFDPYPNWVDGLGGRAVSVAGGGLHSLAVLDDGTVRAWGSNGVHQLGDGSTVDRATPVVVPGLSAISSVAGGGYHSVAVRRDGAVVAWGWNGVGQLGDGTTAERATPEVVPGVNDAAGVAAGYFHTLTV